MTELGAVRKVEEFLSEPFDEAYFNMIKDDLFGGLRRATMAQLAEYDYICRGNLMTDLNHYEGMQPEVKKGL